MKKRKKTDKPLFKLGISLLVVLLLAYILSSFFYRLDLTSEKRYTLSSYSKKSLRNLNKVVYVKVYLDGELNIPFRKMEQRIKETLDEFKVYAGNNLKYEFINPFAGKDAKVRTRVPCEGQRNFKGKILGVTEGRLELEIAPGKQIGIALMDIEKANLIGELSFRPQGS